MSISALIFKALRLRGMTYMGIVLLAMLCAVQSGNCSAADANGEPNAGRPLLQIGPGDQLRVDVFGQPGMSTTTYVTDDGALRIPLAGAVPVAGLSPDQAARRVEAALKEGQYLVAPHVTIDFVQQRSQRISVLGEVKTPGRYVIDANTSIMDLLAQAGGVTDNGADHVIVIRHTQDGGLERTPIDIRDVTKSADPAALRLLVIQGSDSVVVPTADKFFISGEVRNVGSFRVLPGMTVQRAIAGAGGLTERGSSHRVTITRQTKDGHLKTISVGPEDLIQPDDVMLVKERLF